MQLTLCLWPRNRWISEIIIVTKCWRSPKRLEGGQRLLHVQHTCVRLQNSRQPGDITDTPTSCQSRQVDILVSPGAPSRLTVSEIKTLVHANISRIRRRQNLLETLQQQPTLGLIKAKTCWEKIISHKRPAHMTMCKFMAVVVQLCTAMHSNCISLTGL